MIFRRIKIDIRTELKTLAEEEEERNKTRLWTAALMHRDKLDSARDSRQVLIHSANAIFFFWVYIYI